MDPSLLAPLALAAVALIAGFIDAIAGGGGLLTVPALLLALPDARMALGTNKGQGVFGSFASLVSFARAGKVDKTRFWPSFLAGGVGSFLGVRLVIAVRPDVLRPIVLVLLVSVVIFFAVRGYRKRPAAAASNDDAGAKPEPVGIAVRRPMATAAVIAGVLGMYDGFFGPGTGTFLITAYTTIFGDDLTRATANAKVANFASNLGAVVTFAAAGRIDFRLALPMAAAQALGGVLGAKAAMKGGERLIRTAVMAVTLALAVRLGWQMLQTK